MVTENLFCTVLVSFHLLVEKYIKNLETKNFKMLNRSVLSFITFYSEDDDHEPVDFNGETISFTCQLIKIK